MVPYRPSPQFEHLEEFQPTFGKTWAFSLKHLAAFSRNELLALLGAVVWADVWSFGVLADVSVPRLPLVLGGWLVLLVCLLGKPRSRVVYGSALGLTALSLAATGWRGGAVLTALSFVSLVFVPAASRLRTFSVLEPLASALGFVGVAWHRGLRAGWQRLSRALVGRRTGQVPWLELGVALGLLVAFGGLFALANPFVRESGSQALGALSRVFASFDRLLLRALGDVGFACAFAALLRAVPGAALFPSRETRVITASARLSRMATFTLVLQNALFAVYNSIDAVFLAARVAPPGMTLQKYAHDGAFWLTVTLVFVTGVAYAFRDAARSGPPLVRKLLTAWLVQGLLLGANVFFRLAFHVHTSGLSDARFIGAFGAGAVVCGLVSVGWAIRRGLSRAWIVRAQASIFAAAVTLYVLAPTHYLAARWDVRAAQQGARLPLVHLMELAESAESAPVLLELLRDDDPIVREGVAGLLVEREWDGDAAADWNAALQVGWRREEMWTMLRASAALEKAAAADTTREYLTTDGRKASAARERFATYVRYMDDQDATISPRLPESGELLIRANDSRY